LETVGRNSKMDMFVVWESKLVPTTLGVFANTGIKKGMVIGKYTGRAFPTMEQLLAENPHSAYALEVNSKTFLDGDYTLYPEASSFLSLVNGTRVLRDCNTCFNTKGEIIACRNIFAGDELVCYYGRDYFRCYDCVRSVKKAGGWKALRLSDLEFERASRWTRQVFFAV
jgi:hypothetical protein